MCPSTLMRTSLLDRIADEVAHGAGAPVVLQFRGKFDAFGNHHNREVFAVALALLDEFTDGLDAEWNFRNKIT